MTKLYDLSLEFSRNLPTYDMDLSIYNPPMIATYTSYEGNEQAPTRKGWYDTLIAMFPHIGTHMDAPAHLNSQRMENWTIDKIPLDRMVGEGVVVGIPKEPEDGITAEELEKATPEIRQGDLVVINTGWYTKYYAGPLDDFEKAKYYASKYPGVGKDAAKWLVDRRVKTLLIDFLAVDSVKNVELSPSHNILLGANIPCVEGIGGQIEEVTGKRCRIICPPVKYVRGDAFPVRVIAVVEE